MSHSDQVAEGGRSSGLISKPTQRAFRELSTDTTLSEIDDMWQDEGFAPGPLPEIAGQRRARFQAYLDAVDWSDDSHVLRALRVFEVVLHGRASEHYSGARSLLERDGYRLNNKGRIVAVGGAAWRSNVVANLTDPSAIHAALDRISRAGHEDPALAIGSAKELIESTAKIVLTKLGIPVNKKDGLQELIKKAQQGLRLHPDTTTPGPDGRKPIAKILGSLSGVAVGVVELRNEGYGTGHGMAKAPIGLHSRHVHLVVAAASAWCQFMLETLDDPKAPWRPTS